jgi:hypothetical protein
MGWSLTWGVIVSFLLMKGIYGVRGDLIQTWGESYFLIKVLFCASLVVPALRLLVVFGRPGMRENSTLGLVLIPFLTMAFLASQVLFQADDSQREMLIWGESWRSCPFNILLISVPLMISSFWISNSLAPTQLRWSGACSGLLAGAISALVYCLHCPETALPFVALWYSLGIAMSTLLGALLGPKLLRW